jgi:hypothetical protein
VALDKQVTGKKSGDPITSSDWNALAGETVRLDSAKLDLANGGTVAGLLTAAGGLNAASLSSGTLGVSLFKPAGDKWSHQTGQTKGLVVITAVLDVPVPTSVLLLGHGHVNSSADQAGARAVALELRVDGNSTNSTGSGQWGVGYVSQPVNTWTPVITLGSAQLTPTPGGHRVDLSVRPSDGAYNVTLNGPTLWVVRLGTF